MRSSRAEATQSGGNADSRLMRNRLLRIAGLPLLIAIATPFLLATSCPLNPNNNNNSGGPTLDAISLTASADVGATVTASAGVAAGDQGVKLRVDWGDGTTDDSASGTGRTETLTHVYAAAGTFTVTFTAISDDGQSTPSQSLQTTITTPASGNPPPASNQPPTLGTVFVTSSVTLGSAVTASADLNDPENQVKLHIDWGDGNADDSALGASRTQSIDHTYAATGTFTVTFTAIDDANQASAPKTAQTAVNPVIGVPSNRIVVATGQGRSDPEGVAAPTADTTLITWKDSRGAARTMTLAGYLYQYDFTFNDNTQVVTRSANDDAFGHPGFGYVVSHNTQTGNSPLGKANAPTSIQTTLFTGGHHAIHHIELLYDRDKEAGGFGIKIPVVIEWLVATGRDHPVWSVTYKMGSAVNPVPTNFDTYRMDVRGPYGSLNFDGAANRAAGDAIGGVAWGDFGLKFITTDAQLTLNSPWTYNTPNTVNFVRAFTAAVNAEMGIVETRPLDKQMGYPDRVYGRERGSTSADAYTDKANCNVLGDNRIYTMPCVGGWPYQLMNFDWDPSVGKPAGEPTGTKLIAWGSPYGWLGAFTFDLFDFSSTADGRGDRSYATFIVLGPKCRFSGGNCDQDGDVAITIKDVEALAAATITNVTAGTLVTQVPAGPGASQMKTIANGYNDTYAAYYLSATANQAAFTFTPAPGKPVKTPIFVLQNFTPGQLPHILVDGVTLNLNNGTASSDTFVSFSSAGNELWITLNRTLTAATDIQIVP